MQAKDTKNRTTIDMKTLRQQALALGFADVNVARFDSLPDAKTKLDAWLAAGMAGDMSYLHRHADLRANPASLLAGAQSALLLRMDYLPKPQAQITDAEIRLIQPAAASVSLYAQGRDYHTVLRQRLQKLMDWLKEQNPDAGFRVFTDSAPVMEVELSQSAGLGWRGKHTLLLNRSAGSFFFLGGILTTLDLAATEPHTAHCGSCTACMDICPTQAIVAPYVVDARRCISYLTIEHHGAIDPALRPLMGNRIYGCDDCQTTCPWNKYAQSASVGDFATRNALDSSQLLELWAWSEAEFLQRMEGSAIRRIGHARWLRNIATALGNALSIEDSNEIHAALLSQQNHPDAAVREHVAWALLQGDSQGEGAIAGS